MKVLFLGPANSPLLKYLRSVEDEVVSTSDPINLYSTLLYFDFIVSYGYRHIIKKDILDKFQGRAINLHISFLPWNRGADPNFWSFIENAPVGVSIHYLDEGIDTGDRKKQQGKGSYHNAKDKERLTYLLVNGWDTPISVLKEHTVKRWL